MTRCDGIFIAYGPGGEPVADAHVSFPKLQALADIHAGKEMDWQLPIPEMGDWIYQWTHEGYYIECHRLNSS